MFPRDSGPSSNVPATVAEGCGRRRAELRFVTWILFASAIALAAMYVISLITGELPPAF